MMANIKGKSIPVDWMWLFKATDRLKLRVTDPRKLSEVARDFEGAPVIERKSEEEGDETYTGYTSISEIVTDGNGYIITLVKEG